MFCPTIPTLLLLCSPLRGRFTPLTPLHDYIKQSLHVSLAAISCFVLVRDPFCNYFRIPTPLGYWSLVGTAEIFFWGDTRRGRGRTVVSMVMLCGRESSCVHLCACPDVFDSVSPWGQFRFPPRFHQPLSCCYSHFLACLSLHSVLLASGDSLPTLPPGFRLCPSD